MFTIPDSAVGSFYAAIIAGILTYLGLVIAKEHRVSEFRQQWIDNVREDIADLIAELSLIVSQYQTWTEKERDEKHDLLNAHFVSANVALMRTRLRLNPIEPNSQEILEILEKTQQIFNSDEPDFDMLESFEKPLLLATQKVLKTEWNRVRRGEPIYVVSKWVALCFSVLAIIAISISVANG
ncbi:hypothetical protein [Parasphingorhabdus sp.]|jgi:hypothetical protein|uniref:hypothetical protein n=1 Tax=Parasphingorhabdus sp. TaxID=2709688 RepID=UPI0039E675F1